MASASEDSDPDAEEIDRGPSASATYSSDGVEVESRYVRRPLVVFGCAVSNNGAPPACCWKFLSQHQTGRGAKRACWKFLFQQQQAGSSCSNSPHDSGEERFSSRTIFRNVFINDNEQHNFNPRILLSEFYPGSILQKSKKFRPGTAHQFRPQSSLRIKSC